MVDVEPVRKEIFINAPARDVFTYLVDSGRITAWMGSLAVLDPRPGGMYSVHITDDYRARGEFVEVVPYSRVVFTWGWEGDEDGECGPGSTTVEITLQERDGGTFLQLLHSGLEGARRASHDSNWGYFMERLAAVSEGRQPV